ncbi:MAG: HAD family phosphatase [Clostridia bacterium]|nr:HAD family phosphatase [Clostridia bacterium]
MGKFDGYLICSDFDGTMAHQAKVSRETCDAIAYFQSEGGVFCPCSGRETSFFHEYEDFFRPNDYVIGHNGSAIVRYGADGKEDELLYLGETPIGDAKEFVRDMLAMKGVRRISVIWFDHYGCLFTEIGKRFEDAVEITVDDIDTPPQKILVVHDGTNIDAIRSFAENKYSDRFSLGSSWVYGYEGQALGTSKGDSALRVKEMAGAHTLICVGDYANDIPMLRVADISYAVGDAIDEVKAAAQRITVPCTEHAIPHIIADIEAEL